ncbi:hypothetical protein ALC57_05433 [Trachymyrmex cornetzi]|uniref:Uncharacterized protein n=1 Tax=Trachymyrmex cornetzi TaxID=471704 RepID=A0A195EAL1_9HYME|nr:hypothetical protein ALC57_05433 [Trachymyrmex cornetzi]
MSLGVESITPEESYMRSHGGVVHDGLISTDALKCGIEFFVLRDRWEIFQNIIILFNFMLKEDKHVPMSVVPDIIAQIVSNTVRIIDDAYHFVCTTTASKIIVNFSETCQQIIKHFFKVSTIHTAQSITRPAAILVLRSRGPWVIYSMTGATLSRARLVHPAQIFMYNRRCRMCVSATDCVIDGGTYSSFGFPIFVHTYRPLFSLRAIVLRNELFAAMKRGDIQRVCQIIAAKLAGVYTTRF